MKTLLRYRIRVVPLILGMYAATCVVIGLSYTSLFLDPPLDAPPGLDLMTRVIPIWAWGIVWTLAGAGGILSAFTGFRQLFRSSFGTLAALLTIWTCSYTGYWLVHNDRSYVVAAILLLGLLGLVAAIFLVAPPRVP